ncbi:hypothetical protein LCGC14_1198780 [marine sediment metagenome]|uniref:Uncharacterized protein n=1 Tax=marine sediment metagenome TaxID=412755 RepID=A0A0F9NZZ3_9ZZZZ
MSLRPEEIRCLHGWESVITPDAVFYQRDGELICAMRQRAAPLALALVERDHRYHLEEAQRLEETWIIP